MFQMALDKAKEHYGDAIWILDKAKEYQKVIMCFIVYRKIFDYISYIKLWNVLRKMEITEQARKS